METTTRLRAASSCARGVLTGRVTPGEAAQRLAVLATPEADELARFGELAHAWNAAPTSSDREAIERRILEEASMLVADTA